jgi:hypothetical protein
MVDKDLSIQGTSSAIEKKVEDALRVIDEIQKTKSLVKTAEELEALERRIVEATDKLAGALVAQKVQDSIKDKELKDEAALLVKTYPKRMKNQGPREVTIRPSRGEPFTVETSYFSQKGKRKKKQNRLLS